MELCPAQQEIGGTEGGTAEIFSGRLFLERDEERLAAGRWEGEGI